MKLLFDVFSDGNIYIFTTNERRKATCNELQAFDANVAKRVAEAEALLAAQVSL